MCTRSGHHTEVKFLLFFTDKHSLKNVKIKEEAAKLRFFYKTTFPFGKLK